MDDPPMSRRDHDDPPEDYDVFESPIPTDHPAEQAVLGACMTGGRAFELASRILSDDDFWTEGHKTIWRAIAEVARSGAAPDAIAVHANLREHKLVTRSGGGAYIATLYERAPIADTITHHARIVRDMSSRRKVIQAAQKLVARASNGEADAATLTSDAVTELQQVRDRDNSDETVTYLGELLADEDTYDWLVPDLLERGDRLVIVAAEGAGKTTMLRQFAVCLAAGLHPLTQARMPDTFRVLAVDAENSVGSWRRKVRPMVYAAEQQTHEDPSWRIAVDTPGRLDITTDRDLSRLHHLADQAKADVLAIGPLYRLVPRAIQTDDDAAPLLAALDTFRDRGMTLLIEAHAGHGQAGGERDLRPRGSSALLGWPEFGIGLRFDPDDPKHWMNLTKWRGDRDERNWPFRLRRGGPMPFHASSDCYGGDEKWTPHKALGGAA
jgi:hypothetical protein